MNWFGFELVTSVEGLYLAFGYGIALGFIFSLLRFIIYYFLGEK